MRKRGSDERSNLGRRIWRRRSSREGLGHHRKGTPEVGKHSSGEEDPWAN